MAEMLDVDSTPLGMGDLSDILKELTGVAAQWQHLGIHLGIRIDKLNVIQLQEVSPTKCLAQMLTYWLRRAYDVTRFGEPTWVKLVEVIGHEAGGGDPSLAMEIAGRHGHQLARSESDLDCDGDGFQPLRQKAHERSTPVQNKTNSRDRQIRELQQEMEELQQKQEKRDQQIRDLQQQLHDCNGQIREKDAVIAMKLQEIQKLQKEVEQAARARSQQSQQIQQKEHVIQAQERQIQELNQQLVASDYVTMQLQQDLLQKENMIQELREENQHFQQKLQLETKEEFLQQPLKLSWKTCKAAPYKMYRGSATVHGSKVYLTPAVDSSQIQMYNSDIEEWSTLPECPVCGFTVQVAL